MHSSRSFSVRFDAEKYIQGVLPNEWNEYMGNAVNPHQEVSIHIKEDTTLGDLKCSDGWGVYLWNGREQFVFAQKGIASFSLTYDHSADVVEVGVKNALTISGRTGALYGVLMALHHSCVGLHGVTVECGHKIVILSAPSGTGKSTLANLLVKHCGARIVNGDFAMLSLSDEGVIFEPTPFCGTSQISLNERVKVDHIVFLSQSKDNEWRDLNGRQSLTHMLNNCFVPAFDDHLGHAVQNNVVRMLSLVRTSAYAFAPTKEAAQLFQCRIMQDE